MKALLLYALLAPAAHATESPPLLDCWDGSFAYGTLKVANSEDGPQLLRVDLASESQPVFLKDVPVKPVRGWGSAAITFYVPRGGCSGTAPTLRCETKEGTLQISYDETDESRKTLSLLIRDVTLRTTEANGSIQAALDFDAGSVGKGSVRMSFRTREDGTCQSFK